MDKRKVIFWFFTLVLAVFEVYALFIKSDFRIDSVILFALLLLVFLIKDRIRLHAGHFFLFGVFLVLHNLGAFGAYGLRPLNIEYDFWVHGFFGLVGALILFRAFSFHGPYRRSVLILLVVLTLLGFSAGHEIVEFLGAITLGEGEGVLFIGVGDLDRFDSHKDMLNGLIGGIVGIAVYLLWESFHRDVGKHKLSKKHGKLILKP